jgi:serine/threonine-protein kinase
MPLPPGTRIGPYEITGWIGAGGMGEVHRARDPRLGRDVAIKMIAEDYAADLGRVHRFEQEARAAGQITHPNILAVYDAGISEGRPFIVSELLEGQSLRDRLRSGAVPLRKTIDYARQIAEGLAAAHDKSIVHRDLKPDNIFITNDGRIKILDFGLAKLTMPDGGETRSVLSDETEPGTILGTAGYMSPEQVRGEAVDARSDLFSFGTIVCEMLTGKAPFARKTPIETMTAILTHDPMPAIVETIPPPIEKVISRSLEKTREARFQSARDLAFNIEVLSSSSITNLSPPHRPLALPFGRRTALGALIAFTLIAIIVFAARYRPVAAAPSAASMRMTVELGSGELLPMQLVQFGDLAAISFDGSQIAFTAQKSAGDSTVQLFVRSLAELKATPLSGTDGANFPFFSPDGRWIAYFANGELLKVPATGGRPQSLAKAGNPRGGAWGSDDTIVFTPDRLPGTVVWRVSADGGNAAPLTTLAAGESMHVFPQLVPGAKYVLYTSIGEGGYDDANLIAQSLETGARKVIQPGGYHGRIVESGHLIFIRDGTLMAAPIDRDQLEVLSPPVRAITDVRANSITGGAQFSVSASGVLAYLTGPSVGGSTPMQMMDRQSALTPLKGDFGNWMEVHFSPDGGRLVMTARGRQSSIWTYDLARETLTRLTADSTTHTDPIWSAGGSRIIFGSRPEGQPIHMEWRSADGSGGPQRILNSTRNQTPAAFHPSGRFLVYCEFANEGEIDLMALPIDGDETTGWTFGEPRALTHAPGRETHAAFSPDGRWIAYVGEETGRSEVFVQPFPEMNRRWQVSNEGGTAPIWSRTKSEIVYLQDGQLKAASYTVRGDIFESEKPYLWADGRVVFRGPARMFDLHPDGNRMVLAPAPSLRAIDNSRADKIVLVFNFFDELRRITGARR